MQKHVNPCPTREKNKIDQANLSMIGMRKEQSKLEYVSEVSLIDYHVEPLVESQNLVQVSAKSYI